MSTQVRERVSRSAVRSARVNKMPYGVSIGEAIGALLALVLLICVLTYYFSSLRPAQDRLRILEAELLEQQKSIIGAATPDGTQPVVIDTTAVALETLEAFKTNHLKPFSSGRIALIKEINALAKKNSVALTSGIDMGSSLGTSAVEGENTGSTGKRVKRKKDEILSTIPSVTFRFSAFGQYPNLRTFINELEHERQFLVINSINLANQEARVASRRSRGEGGASTGVMLTIEMSAYFQPINGE